MKHLKLYETVLENENIIYNEFIIQLNDLKN